MLAAECLLTLEELFRENKAMAEMEAMQAMKENLPPEVLSIASKKDAVSSVENKDIMPLNAGQNCPKNSTMLRQNPLQNSVILQAPLPSPAIPSKTSKTPAIRCKGRKKVSSIPLKQLPTKYIKKEHKKEPKGPTRRSARLVEKWIKKED